MHGDNSQALKDMYNMRIVSQLQAVNWEQFASNLLAGVRHPFSSPNDALGEGIMPRNCTYLFQLSIKTFRCCESMQHHHNGTFVIKSSQKPMKNRKVNPPRSKTSRSTRPMDRLSLRVFLKLSGYHVVS